MSSVPEGVGSREPPNSNNLWIITRRIPRPPRRGYGFVRFCVLYHQGSYLASRTSFRCTRHVKEQVELEVNTESTFQRVEREGRRWDRVFPRIGTGRVPCCAGRTSNFFLAVADQCDKALTTLSEPHDYDECRCGTRPRGERKWVKLFLFVRNSDPCLQQELYQHRGLEWLWVNGRGQRTDLYQGLSDSSLFCCSG